MTKAELVSSLEWFRDDAEIHLYVPHEALDGIGQVLPIKEVRYNLMPGRVDIVADNGGAGNAG